MISSKFSTGPNFSESGAVNYAKMENDQVFVCDNTKYTNVWYEFRATPENLSCARISTNPSYPSFTFIVDVDDRSVKINGYKAINYHYGSSSPSTSGFGVGLWCDTTKKVKMWIPELSQWADLN